MATIIGPVIPVGRGDNVVALHVYDADDLATTRALAGLRATVAAQALTIARQAAEIAELEARLGEGRRWYVLRRPAWSAPDWALGALGLVTLAGARIDALWDCRPLGE